MSDRARSDAARQALRDALAATARRAPLPAAHLGDDELAGYLARELDAQATERVERHAAACWRCAEDLQVAAHVLAEAGSSSALDRAPERAPEPVAERAARDEEPQTHPRLRDVRRPLARPGSARATRGRSLRIAATLALVAGAGLLAAAGGRIALGRLQPLLLAQASARLGRGVSAEGTSFALLGGPGLRVSGVHVADDARFSRASFVEMGDLVLRASTAALLRGELHGAVEIDDGVLRLVREAGGTWNVETLGHDPESSAGPRASRRSVARSDARRPGRAAEQSALRLTSASIRNATIEIADRAKGDRPATVLRGVDLSYSSPDPTAPARIAIDASVGQGGTRTIAIQGEIGPFDGAEAARYRLAEVALQQVPVAEVPGAPKAVSGDLSFRGQLATSGAGMAELVANASGGGDLRLSAGALDDGNLSRELVGALGRELAPDGAAGSRGEALLAAIRRDPALAPGLAAPSTTFDDLAARIELDPRAMQLTGLELATRLFDAAGSGSLTRAGALDASGTLRASPELTRALAAASPALGALVGSESRLALPFRATGAWPAIRLELDVDQALAAAARRIDPRSLAIALGPAELLHRASPLPRRPLG